MKRINLNNFLFLFIMLFILSDNPFSYSQDKEDFSPLERAYSLYNQGDFYNSLRILDEISIKNLENTNTQNVVLYYQLRGLIRHLLGDVDGAKSYFIKANDFIDKIIKQNKSNTQLIQLKSLILFRIGSAFLSDGNDIKAKEYFNKVLDIGREINDNYTISLGLYGMGFFHALDNNFTESIEYLSKSMEYSMESDNEFIKIKNLILLSIIYLKEKKIDKTNEYISKSLLLLEKQSPSFQSVNSYLSILNILDAINDYSRSEEHLILIRDLLEKTINDSIKINYKFGEINYYLFLGKIYEKKNKIDESIIYTRKALFLSQESQAPDLIYKCLWQLGRLSYNKGDNQKALSLFKRAFETLESIKSTYMNVYIHNINLTENPIFIFYLQYADLILKIAKQATNDDERQKYIYEAREVMERSKIAELQNYFKDECVVPYQSKPSTLDNISPDTSIIYPIVFSDRLDLLVTLPSYGIKLYSININSNEFNELINNFRIFLEKRTTIQYKYYAKKLYELIFNPIQKDLKENNIKNLVIVPDSLLRTIPLSALYDGSNYLIEKYSVSVTPGLTLTNPIKIDINKSSILVGGITKSVQGFPPLPAVNDEINSIKSIYKADIIKDDDFTKANIRESLRKREFDIVHIASHGLFEGKIRDTFILAYDGRISMSLLQELMSLSMFRERPVELLTLSACDTAAGDDKAALGLAGVAVKAGARSAFATLWQVSDVATSILVSNFYENLKTSKTKSEALQKAQLRLIRDDNFGHPYYWSPFLIIGNWL